MIAIINHQGEEIMIHSEIMEFAIDLVAEKPLTIDRVNEIRDNIQGDWVNVNVSYGGGSYFSDNMFQYYLHRAFEITYGTLLN